MDNQQHFDQIIQSNYQDAQKLISALPSGLKFKFEQLSQLLSNQTWSSKNNNLSLELLNQLIAKENHIEQLTTEQALKVAGELTKAEENKEKVFKLVSSSLSKWKKNGTYYIMSEDDVKLLVKSKELFQILQKLPKFIKFESTLINHIAQEPEQKKPFAKIIETIVNKQLLNSNISLDDLSNAIKAAEKNSKQKVFQKLYKVIDANDYQNMYIFLNSLESQEDIETYQEYLKSQKQNEYNNGQDPFNFKKCKIYNQVLNTKQYSKLMLNAVYELNKTKESKTILSYSVLFSKYGDTFPNLPSKYLIVPEEEIENFKNTFGPKGQGKVLDISQENYKQIYEEIFKQYKPEKDIFEQPKSETSSVYEKYQEEIQNLPNDKYNELMKEMFKKMEDSQQQYDIISFQNINKMYKGNISKQIPNGYIYVPDEDIDRIARIYCSGSLQNYNNNLRKGQEEINILKSFNENYPPQKSQQIKN